MFTMSKYSAHSMWWLRRGLCRPSTTHQHRDPVMRNSAQGLALALQTTNPSFDVRMRDTDTEDHWYQCVPLVEPDTDHLLARSPKIYDSTCVTFDSATRAYIYDALFSGTDLHCQIRCRTWNAMHQYGRKPPPRPARRTCTCVVCRSRLNDSSFSKEVTQLCV